MRDIEMRNLPGVVEFRASDKGPGTLAGYAAVFNKRSQNLGGFVEEIDPGAFTKTLQDAGQVFARFNHEDNYLLGTTLAATLRLEVDGTGLRYEVDLPDTTAGRDVAVLAKRGDLSKSSFAFRTIRDDWGYTDDDFLLRKLKEVALVDVAPVVNPAYMDTSTGLRSFAAQHDLDIEEVRRAALDGKVRALLEKDSSLSGDGGNSAPGDPHPLLTARRRLLSLHIK